MAEASEYLLEIAAHDGVALRTIRLSSSGYVTSPTDNPANTEYAAAIQDPGTFRRSLVSQGRTMGEPEAAFGEIVAANADGMLDAVRDYGVDGRSAVLKRLNSSRAAYGTAETIMRATLTGMDSGAALSELRFRLYDRLIELQKPLQTSRYLGTTVSAGPTANGTTDLKDRIKPLVFGKVFNIELICVNPFNLLYQASDGPVASIACFDGGVALINAGDYPTIAALIAASINGGRYATCLALGLVRPGSKPFSLFTADVVEGASLAARSASAIAQRVLAKLGFTGSANLVAATFAALQIAAPQELGIYISDETSALSVLGAILGSIGGYIVPNALGQFEVGRIGSPGASTWTITDRDVQGDAGNAISIVSNPDTDGGIPAYRVVLRHSRVWRVQSQAEVADCPSADRVTYLGTEYREAKAENLAVLTKHLLASELVIDTLLTNAADAAAEAARRLALYSVRRDVMTFPVRRDDATAMVLGSSGTVTLPRLVYQSGRPMIVIGREENPATESVTLTLWG